MAAPIGAPGELRPVGACGFIGTLTQGGAALALGYGITPLRGYTMPDGESLPSPADVHVRGITGESSYVTVRSAIEFTRDDIGVAKVRGEFLAK